VNRKLPPHPNVVQLFGVSSDGPQPVIVMEYCEGGKEKTQEHKEEE
jgi:serine/threonine protein kinase